MSTKRISRAVASALLLAAFSAAAAQPNGDPAAPARRGLEIKIPGEEYLEINQLEQPPQPTTRAAPVYPLSMRRAGITGEVTVDFIVDAQGEVRNVSAVRSSRPEFEKAAVEAVSQWKFTPGKIGGRPVNTHMQVPIIFSLSPKPPSAPR